jgi:beta-galactosidase
VTAHHCVNDIFRLPKGFGAYALASQADASIYGPMVKIMSYWRNSDQGKIYVASNASEVELLINGKSLGRAKPTEFLHIPNPLFAFKVASFDPGEVEARAWMDGKVVATDKVRTPGHARRLVLNSDDSHLVADGADMTRVIAEAVDETGTRIPSEDRRIFVEVKNGRFIGENPIHLEGGRIVFYVQTREGSTLPIAVSATAEGLEGGAPLRINAELPTSSLVPLSDFDTDRLPTKQ